LPDLTYPAAPPRERLHQRCSRTTDSAARCYPV
jgi:hypothetical protein